MGDYTVVPEKELSDDVRQALNKDTKALIDKCAEETKKTLEGTRQVLDRFRQRAFDARRT